MAQETDEFICDYCGRAFKWRKNILRHIQNFHVSATFFCDICESKFCSPAGLQQHRMRGHNRFQQGNPECNECGKIFTRKENVAYHLKTVHSTGKKILKMLENICDVCKKKFTNVKNLKAHVRKLHSANFEHPSCDECNKVFRSKESLITHIQTAHKVSAKNIHRCHLCEKVYSCQKNLKRHLLAFHGVTDEYQCTICSKKLESYIGMRRHVKTAHDIDLPKEYTCEICTKVFSEQSFLDSHVSLHHKQDSLHPQKFSCECGKEFDSEPTLRQHIKSDHEFEVFYSYCKNSLLRTVSIGAEKSKATSGHDCEICQEHFGSLYDLRNHMKADHGLQFSLDSCKVCFTQFYSKEAMAKHQKVCVPPNDAIKCSECDKLFTAKASLNLHMTVFHPETQTPSDPAYEESSKSLSTETNETKCKHCDKSFKSKWNVQQHIEYVHLGMQRFRCLDCESHFKERRNLRKHIRLKHPRSSTFPQCHFCQKRFESANMCKIHLKQVHSFDTNTFACEMCSATYTTNDSLTLHMKTKHSDEEELFKCESCSIIFKGYETFEKHNQKCQENTLAAPESKPNCVICMKDFCTEKSLKRHIKTFHTGLNPDDVAAIGFSKRLFVVDCEECLKLFTDDGMYQIYLKNKHISEAIVFKCPKCANTFNVTEFAVQRYKKTMKTRKRKRASNGSDDD